MNRRNSDATGSSKNTGSQFYRSQSMTSPQCNNIDITKKVMNVSWCPDGQMVAVAGNAGLYIYKV